MHDQNLDRLAAYLRERGLRAALLSNPFTITWLTGYAPPIQTGPNPFEGGPALGWWQHGRLTLVVSDAEAPAARASGAEVVEYASYTYETPLAGTANQIEALQTVLAGVVSGTPAGLEYNFLPAPFLPAVQAALGGSGPAPLDGCFDTLRAIKTEPEVAKIRRSLALCDMGQAMVSAAVAPGVTELDLWAAAKAGIENAAGTRVPLLADLVAGLRTADVGGLPGPYVVEEGDAVMVDLVPRCEGYWGDCCAAYFAGEPSPELARIYDVAAGALRRGIAAIRPGLRAAELDALLRDVIASAGYTPYPHHSGHGIGAAYHEEPRIVPYSQLALAAGMVLMLEPGIYVAGLGGVRLEHALLVTPDGCEVLTRHLPGI